jgi:hypothetical protein
MTRQTNTIAISEVAHELTFGVEIETIVPYNANPDLRIGEYHDGRQVPYLPAGWTASRDSSLHARYPNVGCEIVSPVLKGVEGIKDLIKVIGILKSKGHKINKTCGVHVHVGFEKKSAAELAKLITIASYLERGLYAITGTKARERCDYCNGVKEHKNPKEYDRYANVSGSARYKLLNITNLKQDHRPDTVEFRCFSGSLEAKKIVGWVQVCLGIVEKALTCKRCPSWNGKNLTGVWKREKEGATECERLLAYLCWGNYGKYPAHQRSYGWISNDISQKAIKDTFRKLAEKYDSQR